MYYISTEDFEIKLELNINEAELMLPVNATLKIYLRSYSFTGYFEVDENIYDVAKFSDKLKIMYDNLSGSVIIHEVYFENNYIEFTCDKCGHILVSGKLSNRYRDFNHELYFENSFDQSFLCDFANSMYEDLKKYL